jgi:hypothetical protein
MKTTRSKDGRLRGNISIKHRVGTDVLEIAVAEILWEAKDAEELYPTFSRNSIVKRTREMLFRYGDSIYETGWSRHEGDHYYNDACEEAPDIVTNYFPEMRRGE